MTRHNIEPGIGADSRMSLAALAREVHKIWKEHVDTSEPFEAADDFFAIGGDSLAMVRIQRDLSSRLGANISMDVLMAKPTIFQIAQYIHMTLTKVHLSALGLS
jgi:aryl carrier-like protein